MMRTILFHLNMFLLAACFLFGCSRRSSTFVAPGRFFAVSTPG